MSGAGPAPRRIAESRALPKVQGFRRRACIWFGNHSSISAATELGWKNALGRLVHLPSSKRPLRWSRRARP